MLQGHLALKNQVVIKCGGICELISEDIYQSQGRSELSWKACAPDLFRPPRDGTLVAVGIADHLDKATEYEADGPRNYGESTGMHTRTVVDVRLSE